MPCRSYEDDYRSTPDPSVKDQLDRLARIACKTMDHMAETDPEALEVLILKDPEVAEWWTAHKEADRKEQEKIAAEKRKKELRKAALSKLSPEERKALGVK